MDVTLKTLFFSSMLVFLLASPSYAQQNCGQTFGNGAVFATCNSLPVLSSTLHWNYHQSNNTADIAFVHAGIDGSANWVAWALNVGGSGMIGAQSLVAFRGSNGAMRAYTSPVSGYGTQLQEGNLSFRVPAIRADFSGNAVTIFATLELPAGRTRFNQVWQNGPLSGDTPGQHLTQGANVQSVGSVDFATGQTTGGGAGGSATSRQRKRHVHGVLNAVSWGILLPIGAILARYLKVFKSADPAWFYLHAGCQTSAYAIGVAGWGTGLKLGADSKGVTQDTHRNIGITLFCLGTLQVFALLLRPKKDHKFRLYWNIYHHSVGYAVIALSIVNIFEGFDVLGGQKNWKKAYIGILIFLGVVALFLEIITWIIVIRRKKANGAGKYPAGTNGANGYGARTQPSA